MQWHRISIPILEWILRYSKGCLDQRKTKIEQVKELILQLYTKYFGLVMASSRLSGLG